MCLLNIAAPTARKQGYTLIYDTFKSSPWQELYILCNVSEISWLDVVYNQ